MTNNTKSKINERMIALDKFMSEQKHLDNPQEAVQMLNQISKFFRAMNDEQRDWVNAVRWCIESRIEWK